MSTPRIILDAAIVILLFVAPLWLPLILLFIGLLFIPNYWEFVLFLFCIELLYHPPFSSFAASLWSLPIGALVFFFVVQHFRKLAQGRLSHF